MGNKDDAKEPTIFNQFYSRGLATARDAWCYNSSLIILQKNIKNLIIFYNEQRVAYINELSKNKSLQLEDFLDFDSTKITWNRGLKQDIEKNKIHKFNSTSLRKGLYRPFFKQNVYFAREINDMVYKIPKLFPNNTLDNRVITIPGLGERKGFASLISDSIPDLNMYDGGCQCFPLYYYDVHQKQNPSLFDKFDDSEYIRRDGISDLILERAQKLYSKTVIKEDIFYYVYGFLHSPEYKIKFANDLKKMLPRIPLVEEVKDFWKFSKAGRQLAELHINYEKVPPYEDLILIGAEYNNFKVTKMRFPKKGQKETISYNGLITIEDIPEKAYQYIVNGKSAIEWIMERYQVTTHKESGIKNDPNDWAEEVGNPRYILDLLLSVINVSVQTVDIVEGLPKLNFE